MHYKIFWADLNPVLGREQAGRRPVLVVSNDIENRMDIVTVLPITSRKPGRRIYPNEILFRLRGKEAIILCHQIRTLSKRRLEEEIGVLPVALRQHVYETLCMRFQRF